MVKINPEISQAVAFIGYKTVDNEFLYAGTVFFTALENADSKGRVKSDSIFWVTARHVIERIKSLGCQEVYVRFNLSNSTSAWFPSRINDWYLHKSEPVSDIALLRMPLPEWADHKAIGPDLFLSPEKQEQYEFGETDEVVIVGLFRHRTGARANIPILRSGAIASINRSDLVQTPLGLMRAILVEARSIGGLSGSPVFVLSGMHRTLLNTETSPDRNFYLLGLIHGHYDINENSVDNTVFDSTSGLSSSQINTGIAIVTPMDTLFDALQAASEHFQRKQRQLFESMNFSMPGTQMNFSQSLDVDNSD